MTSDELTLWIARNQIKPIDNAYRNDIINASGYALLANVWGAKVKPKELIPEWNREELPQDVKAIMFRAYMEGLKQKEKN